MRLERINENKIKIFITLDELLERGLSKDDVGKDSFKWQELFYDMMEEAKQEYGFACNGTIAVDIFSLQTQGMVLILTIDDIEETYDGSLNCDVFEMKVNTLEHKELLYTFHSIEDCISFARRIKHVLQGGQLLYYNQKYFYHKEQISPDLVPTVISILAEYGEPAVTTIPYIYEYGKIIMEKDAIQQLNHFFEN